MLIQKYGKVLFLKFKKKKMEQEEDKKSSKKVQNDTLG
jgi:hypothetical protein